MNSRLTFIREVGKSKAIYLCTCGKEVEYLINAVNKGWKTGCGCRRKRHGLSSHKLYESWCRMRERCYNPHNPKYYRYGGRGVVVCDEWRKDFKVYYDWCMTNGWKPGLQIDKDIKGNGLLYSPEMCIIVTNKENCNKRSHTKLITRKGETKSIMQWCEFYGLNQSTLYSRLNTGWSFEMALITPKQNTTKRINNRK